MDHVKLLNQAAEIVRKSRAPWMPAFGAGTTAGVTAPGINDPSFAPLVAAVYAELVREYRQRVPYPS